jgi:UDP-N-acetyl-D-mannosaminuronic acid transferase (WecB/TagA/CpsF family)
VYGPELMEAFCEETARKGYRHYFYRGAEGVAEGLARRWSIPAGRMVCTLIVALLFVARFLHRRTR